MTTRLEHHGWSGAYMDFLCGWTLHDNVCPSSTCTQRTIYDCQCLSASIWPLCCPRHGTMSDILCYELLDARWRPWSCRRFRGSVKYEVGRCKTKDERRKTKDDRSKGISWTGCLRVLGVSHNRYVGSLACSLGRKRKARGPGRQLEMCPSASSLRRG